jgi:hypothetical protein
LIEHDDGNIEFPRVLTRAQVHNVPKAPAAVAYTELVDPVALIAFLFSDFLIAALDREIDAEADDPSSLSSEARAKAEAETMGDLLAVERDESALLWEAQKQGLACEHRADCSPLAILQCRLITTPHAVPSLGSSLEHAIDFVGGRR